MERKNDCIDISSDKQAEYHTRRLEHGDERESLKEKITVQNKAIDATIYSIYRLCADREETINPIISECSKLAQRENETWHD